MSKFSSEVESTNNQPPESITSPSDTVFSPAEIQDLTQLIELRAKSFAKDYEKSSDNTVFVVNHGQDSVGATANLQLAYQELVSKIAAAANYEISDEEIVTLSQMRNLSFGRILEVVSNYILAERNKPVYSISFAQREELLGYISDVEDDYENGFQRYFAGSKYDKTKDEAESRAFYDEQIMITILYEIARVSNYPRSGRIVRQWLNETNVSLDSIFEFAMEKMNIEILVEAKDVFDETVIAEIQTYIGEVEAKSEQLVENMTQNAAAREVTLSKEDAETKTRQLQLLAIVGDIMSRLAQQGYASSKSYDELIKFVESEDLDFENVFEKTVKFLVS